MRLYGLRDRISGSVEPQSMAFFANDEVIKRFLQDSISGQHIVARHPEDFELWCFGVWDFQGRNGMPALEQEEERFVAQMQDVLRGVHTPLSSLQE